MIDLNIQNLTNVDKTESFDNDKKNWDEEKEATMKKKRKKRW